MDNANFPKKRGRKKKVQVEEAAPPSQFAHHSPVMIVPTKSTVATRPSISKEERDQFLERKNKRLNFLQEQARKVDEKTTTDEFINSIHEKFVNYKYPNYHWREEGFDVEGIEVYNKVQKGDASTDEIVRWTDVITKEAIKKICDIVEHLLNTGPMSKGETDLYNRLSALLIEYYADRTRLVIPQRPNRNYYYNSTYYPSKDSAVFQIFFNKDELPVGTVLLQNE